DLGCGSAEPIAKFLIEAGCRVTGVDVASAMIALCRERYPDGDWIEADMRELDLGHRFDAIIAWDSFFHLDPEDQRAMFPVFARHAAPGALLLFTAGPRAGVAMGEIYGHALYHASLDAAEYRDLLTAHGFGVLLHRIDDPDCGRHTVWLAQRPAEG
ncbi:MAG: class I SAM-dependent methyltransferase, partial [Burkholderiales bacterium]|nr:class I SAM-dependent methyltransferase [Burkholderiales bacterium]